MRKTLSLLALAVFVTAFAPRASADIATQMVLSDSFGDSVSIDVSSAGILTFICNSGSCGNINATTTTVDKAHGTITITNGTLGTGTKTFLINATGVGGADSNLPTLQDLNQINALASSTGTLTTFFTDTAYPFMSSTLNVANSETTDIGIAATSSSDFRIFTSATNQLGGGLLEEDDTLVGHSNNDGVNGTNFANPNATGSLTTETILSFGGAGRIQANDSVSNVAAVPEPASFFLFGGAMVLTAGVMKRRRKNAVK